MLSRRVFDVVAVRRALAPVAVLAGLLAWPSGAAALTDFTWSGANGAANWSAGGNWVGGTAPGGAVGTLSFPALTPGACTTCYQSSNDLSGVSANAISIDDGVPYQVTGSGIALGAGGITAAPSASDTGSSANLGLPITLGAPQAWSITGGASSQQLGVGTVTGSGDALAVNFSSSGVLAVGDLEAGAITLTGDGVLGVFGSLNGSDGNPVGLSSPARLAALVAGATSGPLTSTGGAIQVGGGHPLDGTLAVNGAIALGSTSSLTMFIDQAGTTPSTDYSQLTASGAVKLGGSALFLDGRGGGGQCPALQVGDVDTLVTTPGSLTGTFSGVPNGTTLTLACSSGTAPTVKIHYTSHSVTATVLTTAAGGTTTTLSASPSRAVTNQTVTLTATVGPSSSAPAGTVEFDNGGAPISGCASRPVALSGSTYTATCQTSLAATPSPSLTATFMPSSSSSQGSTSSVDHLLVNQDSTTTGLAVSSATPTVGDLVTYTATVAPADSGPVQPSGSVQFLDGGAPIAACAGQGALLGGQATCVVSYGAPGAHSISVSYPGDGNFTGSASSVQAVNVVPPPPMNVSPPSISGSTIQGQTLTETHGSWTNNPAGFTYQWQRCDSVGNGCTSIPGATSAAYTLTAADVGNTIRVQEAAFNAGGSSNAASSATTGVIGPIPAPPTAPVSTSPPVLTGVVVVGRTLSTSNGLWSGTPPSSYAYQWQRCTSGGCANIAGATGTIYSLVAADAGTKVRVVIVAINSAGYGVAVSHQAGPVIATRAVRVQLAKQLVPKGRLAKIGAILKAGGYTLSFAAPEPGRVVISWYLLPKVAHLAKAKPVLVATGHATFATAGTKRIKIKLTPTGRNLLRHANKVTLTAKQVFSPPGQASLVALKTFTLKR